MNVTLSVTGEEAIDRVLREMPLALTHKVLGQAHYAAAQVLVEKQKLLAPEGPTGNLVDSIGATKTSISKADSLGEVRVGPRRGGKYKGYAGHLVEYGTVQRKLRGKGKYASGNRGVMPKKPFAQPAFQATKGQIENSIALNIGKVLIRTMKRTLK